MSKPPLKPIAEVPQPPKCFKEGCDDWGSYGFTFPGGRRGSACGAHRAEMDAAWTEAVQAKVDADAQAVTPAQGRLL
jgi:hypothetical protein